MIISRSIFPGCRNDSDKNCREKSKKKDNVRINVTFRSVRTTIVALEKQ